MTRRARGVPRLDHPELADDYRPPPFIERDGDTLTVDITADTSRFTHSMRRAEQAAAYLDDGSWTQALVDTITAMMATSPDRPEPQGDPAAWAPLRRRANAKAVDLSAPPVDLTRHVRDLPCVKDPR